MRLWLATLATLATFGLAAPRVALANAAIFAHLDQSSAPDHHAAPAARTSATPRPFTLSSLPALAPFALRVPVVQPLRLPIASFGPLPCTLRPPTQHGARAPPSLA